MRTPLLLSGFLFCLAFAAISQSTSTPAPNAAQNTVQGQQQNSNAPELKRRSQETVEAQRKNDRQIELFVMATDGAGKGIRDLQQQDFSVLSAKQPQTITSFKAVQGDGAPVEVVIAIDLINVGFDRIAFERQEVEKFLLENDGKLAHPVRVVIVTETGVQMQPQASRDGKAIVDALNNARTGIRPIGRSAGAEGAVERLQTSLKYFSQLAGYLERLPERKMLLWVSPGWPMLSSPAFSSSRDQQRKLFGTIVAMTNDLRMAHITLYALDPLGLEDDLSRQYFYQSFTNPVMDTNKATTGNLSLQVLALHSGGQVMTASNDLASKINACVADADAYYLLSFDSTPADKVDDYRSLTVTINKPGVKARTTTGYYAQP